MSNAFMSGVLSHCCERSDLLRLLLSKRLFCVGDSLLLCMAWWTKSPHATLWLLVDHIIPCRPHGITLHHPPPPSSF